MDLLDVFMWIIRGVIVVSIGMLVYTTIKKVLRKNYLLSKRAGFKADSQTVDKLKEI